MIFFSVFRNKQVHKEILLHLLVVGLAGKNSWLDVPVFSSDLDRVPVKDGKNFVHHQSVVVGVTFFSSLYRIKSQYPKDLQQEK